MYCNEKREEIELLITGYNLGVDYIKMHPQKEWEQVLIEIGVPENLTGLVALPGYQKAVAVKSIPNSCVLTNERCLLFMAMDAAGSGRKEASI